MYVYIYIHSDLFVTFLFLLITCIYIYILYIFPCLFLPLTLFCVCAPACLLLSFFVYLFARSFVGLFIGLFLSLFLCLFPSCLFVCSGDKILLLVYVGVNNLRLVLHLFSQSDGYECSALCDVCHQAQEVSRISIRHLTDSSVKVTD